jgi:hypothetical protein
MSASASSPAVWPSVRGSPRRLAQRPFPSMMHATWSRGEPDEFMVLNTLVRGSVLADASV